MPWAVAGGVIAAGGALGAASMQAGAAKDAQQTQMQMYNQMRSDLMPYNVAGRNAINAMSSFLGLGSTTPSAADNTQTLGNIKNVLTSWNQANPGSANNIISMIDSGASLQQVQAAMQSLRATTTNPRNTSFLDSAINQAANPVMGTGGAGGPAGGPTAASAANAFQALQQYPGYQFQFGQGLQALNRNLAAGGRYSSGAMMKDATQFGQGQAESSVRDYLSLLQYLGSTGQSSAAGVGNAGINTGAGVAQSQMAGATAWGSGIAGSTNAIGQALQNQYQSFQTGGYPSWWYSNNTGGAATYGGGVWTPGPEGFPVP